MSSAAKRVVSLTDDASDASNYILGAVQNPSFYQERTDRSIGWITQEEQDFLKNKTIGIAGCGAMGGMTAQILLRAGIGCLKLADTETFDASNINRQFGATRHTIGKSKAIVTARMLHDIANDVEIHVYPRGITEQTVDEFVDGCDLILDAVEYWALAGRILLHRKARAKGIHLMNGTVVGFGTRLFLFTPEGASMEELCLTTYEEAKQFEERNAQGLATTAEKIRAMASVSMGLMPEFVNYTAMNAPCGNLKSVTLRMGKEGKGPVLATNPPMVCGFLANHVLLHLLRASPIKRKVVALPPAPGYLFFDAAKMKARIRRPSKIRQWIHARKVSLFVMLATRKLQSQR